MQSKTYGTFLITYFLSQTCKRNEAKDEVCFISATYTIEIAVYDLAWFRVEAVYGELIKNMSLRKSTRVSVILNIEYKEPIRVVNLSRNLESLSLNRNNL